MDRSDRKMSFHLPRVCHSESTRHDYRDAMVFKKLRLQNVFYMKTKSQRFQIPPVLEAFPKSRNFVIASSYVLTPYSCNTTANTRAPPPLPPTLPLVPNIQSILLFKPICKVALRKWNTCQRDRINKVVVLVTDLAVHT